VQRRDTAEDDSSMSMAGSHTFGRYNNFANAAHMLCRLVRRTSGNPHAIDPWTDSLCSCAERCQSCVEVLAEDWQMNLRGGVGRKPEDGWRRYFSRKQASFDAIQRICNPNDEAYQSQLGTPVDNTFDRHKGSGAG
ncbi:litaf, partial [Symbiodinium necroappetens]